jgi:1-acyl-sn-glycerol-3-phosphate acyltransferase
MMKFLSKIIFWLAGWSLQPNWPQGVKKAVLIAIPHTSNWDLMYARAAFYLMDIPAVRFTIKKEVMIGPLGWFLSSLGAIPIDRKRIPGGKKQTYTEAMTQMLNQRDELVIMVTPEGTRSAVKKWKSGFYHTALGANVPIVVGYLDYKKKEAGIGPCIYPNGDMEGQIEELKAFGRTVVPKYPEKGIL